MMESENNSRGAQRHARRYSQLDRVASATSASMFWQRFEEAANELGFPYYIYVFARRDGSRFHRTNLSAQHYLGPEHDPFMDYCCNNLGHTLTGPEYLRDYPYLAEGEAAFIRAASGSGMVSGIGMPVRTRHNPEYGGFNLGTGLAREGFEAGPLENLERARTLCLVAQGRIDELRLVDDAGKERDALATGSLTNRERQVFNLVASGLRREEVARRAGISPHTASTHIKRIYRKLGIHSQAEAVARGRIAVGSGG